MKPLDMAAFALLCALGSDVSVFAHQPQPARSLPHRHPARSQKVLSPQRYVDAIIRAINPATGVLTVETATEVLQVRLTPEEARKFQVGEKIQVQLRSADTRV